MAEAVPTLGAMKARIANELARSDLAAEIASAIASAIQHYERRRFAWNEATATFTTVIGREYYDATDQQDIPSLVKIDSLRINIGGDWDAITPRTFAELDALAADLDLGDPTDFCIYQGQLRLYPIPNVVRTLRMAYVRKLPALTDDTEQNAWTADAEELIRIRAKVDVLENVIREDVSGAEADRLRRREGEVLSALLREAGSRAGAGVIQAHYL